MRDKLMEDLRTLRDEAKVRIHLATMDARDAWQSLHPLLAEVKRDLAGVRADATARAEGLIARAKKIIHPPVDSML
jgi:hypothetical protein